MTTSKKILPHILILLIWFSRAYCQGEEFICTVENEQLCYLLCDSYRREIDLCSYFPSLCETEVNCEEVAYKCWNEIPDCGQISISDKTEVKRGASTRFLFLKLHPLFSQNLAPRLSSSARYRRIGQRFGSEFLGKRHFDFPPRNETEEETNRWKMVYEEPENLQEEKRSNKVPKIRNLGSEFLGKRSEQDKVLLFIPNNRRYFGNELLGKRGFEFLGKRGSEFLGKRGSEFLGKRGSEFLGKRGSEFLGKRGSELLGKRGSEYLGKRGSEFLGKRSLEFLGKRSLEFLGKRGTEFLGKRNFEFLGKRNGEFLGKRDGDEAQDLGNNLIDDEFDRSNSSDLLLDVPSKRGKGGNGVKLGSEFLGKRFGQNNKNSDLTYGEPEYRNFVKNDKKFKTNSNSNQKKERMLGKVIPISEFLG